MRRAGGGAARRAGFRGTGGGFPPPIVSISGTVTIGGTLTATESGGPVTSRKWQRGNVIDGTGTYADIGGATAATYSPVIADIGYSLRYFASGVGGSATSNTLIYSVLTAIAPVAWVDYSNPANTIVSDAFSVLADKSGLGSRDWSQGTAGARPGSTRTVNSRTAGDFDGIDDLIAGPTTTLLGIEAHAFEFWVVFNPDVVPVYIGQKNGACIVNASPLSSMRFWLNFDAGFDASTGGCTVGWFNGTADVSTSTGSGAGEFPVAGTTYRARAGWDGAEAFVKLGSAATATTTQASGISGTQALETGKNGDGVLFMNGLVCEVGVKDDDLSSDQRADLDAYLTNKWGAVV